MLDATVTDVIGNAAFRANLGNGHSLVAYLEGADKPRFAEVVPGGVVTVEMSPYDMSKGRIRMDKTSSGLT